MPDVRIRSRMTDMPAYVAVPAPGEASPGVVVIHDAFGMTSDLRHQADWLAAAGFLTVAPDLFSWASRARCVVATMRAVSARRGRPFDDVDAARRWLAARDDCTGRIGVIGFCLGGGFALALAAGAGYSASSVNYGAIADPETVLVDACPIVGSFGARDRSLRSFPDRLHAVAHAHDIEHDIEVYPDAGHGFLNDHAPGETPVWARIGGRFLETAYHEASAVDARRRIVSFFDTHLRS